MRKIVFKIFFMLCLYQINTLQAQQTTTIDSVVNKVFGNLDLSILQTNYLIDKGQFIITPDKFTGVELNDHVANADSITAFYKVLKLACSNCSYQLPDDVISKAQNEVNNNVVPIGIFNMDYDKIKLNAFEQNLLQITNDQIFDVAGRSQSPYEVKRLFAASPFVTKTTNTSIDFKIDNSYYFDNTNETVSGIQIDFGDGLGYQPIVMGSVYTINYNARGNKTIKVKLITPATTYVSASVLQINEVPQAPNTIEGRTPDYTIPVTNIASRKGSHTVGGVGHVFLGCDNVLDRPIILIEGFDGVNNIGWSQIVNQYGFVHFLSRLEGAGYDVIMLDFDEATDYIQNNAAVFRNLLEQVNASKTGNHEVTVIGASMGGLIGRYELARMETENQEHNVGLFISYDSPHKGANVPIGLQLLTKEMAEKTDYVNKLINAMGGAANPFKEIQDQYKALTSPAAKQMLFYHGGPEKNALYHNFRNELRSYGGQTYPHKGYPRKCRNVSMFDGSNSGVGIDGYNNLDHQKILEIRGSNDIYNFEVDAWSNPNASQGVQPVLRLVMEIRWRFHIFGTAHYLIGYRHDPVYNIDGNKVQPIDRAPGGVIETQEQVREAVEGRVNATVLGRPTHCFVPSVSAIDLDVLENNDLQLFYDIVNQNPVINGNTPFDAIYGMAGNTGHVTLDHGAGTVNGVTWDAFLGYVIEQELQPENFYLQDRNISTSKNFEARSSIFIGNGVTPANFSSNAVTRSNGDVVINSGTTNIRAGQEVRFMPGFEIKSGSSMHAYIDGRLVSANCDQSIVDGARTTKQQIIVNSVEEKNNTTNVLQIESDRLKAYPNPTSGLLNISYLVQNDSDYVTINLHNMFGQTVDWVLKKRNHPKGRYKVSYDTGKLKKGLYYCTFRTSKIRKTLKIIVK